MRVVSFNVNSIRVRLHQLEAVIRTHNPDIIGLQETKVSDDDFPLDEIEALGYQVQFHGQKSHYGVALLSRVSPLTVKKGHDDDTTEAQSRLVSAEFPLTDGRRLRLINGYFPQGESRDHPEKFPAKEAFYKRLKSHVETGHDPADPLILIGDMNVAPVDQDIGIGEKNMKRWLKEGKCCFLPEEREWLNRLTDWGMVDVFRHHYPDTDDRFSWFDYRSRGFERDPKRGLRIDLILASHGIIEHTLDAGIDYDIRAMNKPSDHCPVWADFGLEFRNET